jgi:hypothetical protein
MGSPGGGRELQEAEVRGGGSWVGWVGCPEGRGRGGMSAAEQRDARWQPEGLASHGQANPIGEGGVVCCECCGAAESAGSVA